MMKLQRDIPTEEDVQFIVIWEYANQIWADTYIIKNKKLRVYCNDRDDFIRKDITYPWEKSLKETDTWFIVKKDD